MYTSLHLLSTCDTTILQRVLSGTIAAYIYDSFNQLDFITLWHPVLFATKNHTYVPSIIYDANYRFSHRFSKTTVPAHGSAYNRN